MTKEEKAELKIAIEQKIKQTEAAILDYKDLAQAVAPDDAIGRLSRMDAINNKSVMEAALRESEAKLARLKNAVEHIDNDPDFGLCISCRQTIPIARLKVKPDANKCMKCAR